MDVREWLQPCVVINLDRRLDRLKQLIGNMATLGLEFHRFAAVDGNRLASADLVMLSETARFEYLARTPQQRFNIWKGMAGCVRSHYEVIRMAKANHWPRVFVLEDDAAFHPRFWEVIELPPADCRIARMGSVVPPKKYVHVKGIWYTARGKVDCTSGYVAFASVYDELLERFGTFVYPADWAWSKTKRRWKGPVYDNIKGAYLTQPIMVGMEPGWSDVSQSNSRYGIQQRTKVQWRT